MNSLINFLLLLIALVLAVLFFPVGIVFTLIAATVTGSARKAIGYLSHSALSVALAIDMLGNTVCADLLNNTMRLPGGYSFGNYRETISLVLGKNKERGTLSKAGRWLADILNKIDPNHVERAATGDSQ